MTFQQQKLSRAIASDIDRIDEALRFLGGPKYCPHGSHHLRVHLVTGDYGRFNPVPEITNDFRSEIDALVVAHLKRRREALIEELAAL